MPFEHYGEGTCRVLGLFEVTHSLCAVLQGLARLAGPGASGTSGRLTPGRAEYSMIAKKSQKPNHMG
eukprot:329754-Prymnesium_polylepis.1